MQIAKFLSFIVFAIHTTSAQAANVTAASLVEASTASKCTTCLPTEECVVQQVQCIRAPCPAIPTCVTKALATVSPAAQVSSVCSPSSCADSEDCVAKQVECVAAPCLPVPTCVPQPATKSCTKKCGKFQRCFTYHSKQYCADTCSPGRCKKNEHCELQRVQCLMAPCPQIATCKPQ